MRSLRILTVLPSIDWRFGGSVAQAQVVARELRRRGHDVTILSTDAGQSHDAADSWRTNHECPTFLAHAGPLHRRAPFPAPARLLAELDRRLEEADLVTSQVGLTLSNVAVSRRCRNAGVPFVYSAQGALDPGRLLQKRWRKLLFVHLCERPLLRRVSAIQALTAEEAAQLRRLGAPADRITVVPNGVAPEDWTGGERERVRARWGVDPGDTVLLFLGRLAPEKGLDLLLEAAAPLLREQRRTRLVLAGPDGGAADLARRLAERLGVADRVQFPGPVSPEQRRHVLAGGDVFVHPSRSEGLPLAVLEAAAAGLPLFVTDRCNLPEVAEYAAGVVAPADPTTLSVALRELVADPERRRRAAREARRMIEERFALPRVVDALEALYRRLTEDRPERRNPIRSNRGGSSR